MRNNNYPLTVEKSIMISDKDTVETYNIYPGTNGSSESGNILGLSYNDLQQLYLLIGQFVKEPKKGEARHE